MCLERTMICSAFHNPYKMDFSCTDPLAESLSLPIFSIDHNNLPQDASSYHSISLSSYPKLKLSIHPGSAPQNGL